MESCPHHWADGAESRVVQQARNAADAVSTWSAQSNEGRTLVPLKLYFNEKGRAKLELALALARNSTINARRKRSALGSVGVDACCARKVDALTSGRGSLFAPW
jgi:hypothetical protein